MPRHPYEYAYDDCSMGDLAGWQALEDVGPRVGVVRRVDESLLSLKSTENRPIRDVFLPSLEEDQECGQ
jgi:hypothetical protein